MHSIDENNKAGSGKKSGRWGKYHGDKRNWPQYNEELVIRGKMLFDLDFVDQWNKELNRMNDGKRGSPFLFPQSFMNLMIIWHQYLDYRCLEGMARSLVDLGVIPYYGDYTTIWNRIHDMKPDIDISGLKYAEIGTDGTGMKTNNAGAYRIMKYGDPDAKRKKHLVVIITADVKTKRIIGIESRVEGNGLSEPETAVKHVRDATGMGVHVSRFYGDGAFDTNDPFNLLHVMGADSAIKIRKNASLDRYRGSKYRRSGNTKRRDTGNGLRKNTMV